MSHIGQGLAPMSYGQALVILAIAIAMSATIALLMWADNRRHGNRTRGGTAPDLGRDSTTDALPEPPARRR